MNAWTMVSENRRVVRRLVDDVFNGRQLDVLDDLFTPDHVHHDPASPEVGPGPRGQRELNAALQAGFPDLTFTVEDEMAEDERVAVRWSVTATHTGDLMGIAPTNRHVSIQGMTVHRFVDGRIAETWEVWDALGMLRQIGAIP